MDTELSLSKTEPSGKLEQEYIYNLQQQVYLQELELKYVKQQNASTTFDSSISEPVDSALHNIKGSYKHMEADFAKRMHQEEDRHNELREEALRAVMHEKRAHAEKTKVVDQLARVREQFSSQRQELTAEVVGLQRELEKCFLTEKTLRTELEQVSTQLKEIRTFSDGADAQVRMKNSQLEESARQLTAAAAREGSLQRDLHDEQAQSSTYKDKYDVAARHNDGVLSQRKEALDEKAAASAESRQLKMELETERSSLQQVEHNCEFLVRESAQLKTARDEVVYSLELASRENKRLKDEDDKGKITRVMGRYMIRKMREKLTVVQEGHKRMEESHFELHALLVKEQQKNEALDLELARERQRAAITQEHYRAQEEGAAQLTVENRLLLERVHQLSTALDEHKKEVETLRNDNVHQAAALKVLRERSSLAKAIATLGPHLEGLKDLTTTNSGLVSAIQGLQRGLEHVPAELTVPAGTIA